MTRKFYILLAAAVVVCSIAAAAILYQTASEIQLTKGSLDNLQWYLPLAEDRWLSESNLDGEIYIRSESSQNEKLIDRRGNTIIEAENGITFGEGSGSIIAFANRDDKYGYMDIKGKILIPARFDDASAFDQGYAQVSTGTKKLTRTSRTKAIDESGKILEDTIKKDPQSESLFDVTQIKGKYFYLGSSRANPRIVDVQSGKTILETDRYDDIWPIDDERFAARIFKSEFGMCCQFLDKEFQILYDGRVFKDLGEVSEGLCYAAGINGETSAKGYIGKDGQLKIKTPKSLWGCMFTEGKALIYEKDKVYAIDKKGNRLFERKLRENLNEEAYIDRDPQEGHDTDSCWFRNGRAVLFDGKKYGIIDKKGNWVVKPVFDRLTFTGEDSAVAEYKGSSGILKVR